MHAAKSIALGLALSSSQVWASDDHMSEVTTDFIVICVQQLPNIANAIEQAKERGFVQPPEGVVPELDETIRNEPEWDHFVRRLGESSLVTLRLAEKNIDVSQQEVLGASTASLCEMGVAWSDFDMSQFAKALSRQLKLGQPILDIVNSGRREMSWSVYIAYNTSTLMLKEMKDSAPYGFAAGLVVPHQKR